MSDALDEVGSLHPSSTSELGRRLLQVLDRFESRSKASSVADRSADQLWKYTRGGTEPPFLPLARLCLESGVRMEWLATGEAPMLSSDAAFLNESQDVRLQVDKLAEAMDVVDTGLDLADSVITSKGKAMLVAAVYRKLVDDSLSPAQVVNFVLKTIKGAVDSNAADR